jgi:hypothetical protein
MGAILGNEPTKQPTKQETQINYILFAIALKLCYVI